MAALVDRIKQKVRPHASSPSADSSPNTYDTATSSPGRPGSSTAYTYASSSPPQNDGFPRTSLENSAFHVSRGSATRGSIDRKPLPQPNGSTASKPRRQLSIGNPPPETNDALNERDHPHYTQTGFSSHGHARGPSVEEQQAIVQEIIPERGSSKHAETTPPRTTQAVHSQLELTPHEQSVKTNFSRIISIPERHASNGVTNEELSKPLPEVPNNHRGIPRQDGDSSVPSAAESMTNVNWMGPMISTGQKQRPSEAPRSHNDAKYNAIASGNLRLPEGFSLQDTEQTHVTETMRPAVTHETIIKQRTEIVQEAITRDIHYHHYYTYVQPIKVVEVLPPKHFSFDPQTGVKTEIPAPPGWTMPADMSPRSPDTSRVVGWTRHYLVDEEHPNGIPEAPPLDDQLDTSTSRQVARSTRP